jgi:hypothetical protein
MSTVGGLEHCRALSVASEGEPVMDIVWRQQAEPRMLVLEVVPVEKYFRKARASSMHPNLSGSPGGIQQS